MGFGRIFALVISDPSENISLMSPFGSKPVIQPVARGHKKSRPGAGIFLLNSVRVGGQQIGSLPSELPAAQLLHVEYRLRSHALLFLEQRLDLVDLDRDEAC